MDGREAFYQWDANVKLIVEDTSISEVHFSNHAQENALVVEVVDGAAAVPNILLQENWDIFVYGFAADYTKHSKTFKVIQRDKPADYVYTETELKTYDNLEKRIEELENNGVDLSDYYTKNEVDALIPSLDGYAKTTDIPDVSIYQTEEQVSALIDTAIAAITDADEVSY